MCLDWVNYENLLRFPNSRMGSGEALTRSGRAPGHKERRLWSLGWTPSSLGNGGLREVHVPSSLSFLCHKNYDLGSWPCLDPTFWGIHGPPEGAPGLNLQTRAWEGIAVIRTPIYREQPVMRGDKNKTISVWMRSQWVGSKWARSWHSSPPHQSWMKEDTSGGNLPWKFENEKKSSLEICLHLLS